MEKIGNIYIYISFEDSLSMNRVKRDLNIDRIRALQRDCIMHMSFEWNGRKANKRIGISKTVRMRLKKACKEVWGKKAW